MKIIKLYGIPNCGSVKKAQDYLKCNKINYEFHDFKKNGVPEELLDQAFAVFGWEKVLNKQGLTYKKLTLEEKADIQDDSSVKSYLINHSSAIKRPILMIDNQVKLLGFDENTYEEILNN